MQKRPVAIVRDPRDLFWHRIVMYEHTQATKIEPWVLGNGCTVENTFFLGKFFANLSILFSTWSKLIFSTRLQNRVLAALIAIQLIATLVAAKILELTVQL